MWTDAFCFFVVPIILVCEGSYSRKHMCTWTQILCASYKLLSFVQYGQ